MKNLLKIALFTIVCSSSSFATISLDKTIFNKKGDFNYLVSNDTVKNTSSNSNTDPRKKTFFNTNNEKDIFIDDNFESYVIKQLINVASDNLGVTYRSGGTTKDGFDCSGLVYSTFKKFDITLPRSSHEMAEIGTEINTQNAQKGDLIFFINRGQNRINHVGMIVEVTAEEIKFIHSSTRLGVIISSTKEPYYDKTFKQINRIVE